MKNQIKRVITSLIMASCCVLFHFILNTLMTEVITGIIIGYFLIEIVFLVYVWFEQNEIVFEDVKPVDESLYSPIEVDKELDYYNQVPLYFIKDYRVYNLKEEHITNISSGRIIVKQQAQHYIDTGSINMTNDLICGSLSDRLLDNVDKTLDTML